jgi:vacuolar-type H+-ATPase subunit I/STV1
LKTELCIQAESLQESTDWKSTSDALIKLQKEWKEIGPVPRKQSEKTWKRFRKACDHFFNRKAEFFANLDTSYEDNLKAKIAVIEELEKFEPGTDVQSAFERLKELQRKWTEIGFVPFNKKEEITNRYRNALNKEFDRLKIADEDKSILKYKTKLDNLKSNPKASRKVRNERDKFFTKIKQLESDIVLWENNIGFFAKSTNADTMIKEVQDKIENAKKMIKTLEEKVKMIDQSGLDD